MKTSVAMATYNGEKYILEQLESIRKQTKSIDEVVISDDCSSDNTCMVIKNYIKKYNLVNWHLLENDENQGYCKNFFKAMYATTGDLIYLSDQDDVWLENKVEVMSNIISEKNLIALFSSYGLINQKSESLTFIPPKLTNIDLNFSSKFIEINIDSLIICSYLRGCALCFRRDVLDIIKTHALDEYCSPNLLGHDWLISIISCITGTCGIYKRKLFEYRIHDENTSLNSIRTKGIASTIDKRIEGIEKSILIHSKLITELSIKDDVQFSIKKAIEFEEKRLHFLVTGKLLEWIKLFLNLFHYKKYYKSFIKGIRVYVGDLIYIKSKERNC